MANAVYPKYKQSLLSADANVDLIQSGATTAPYVVLIDTNTYTYSAAHQFYTDLSGIVGTEQQLVTPVVTSGTFDADNVTFTAVASGTARALGFFRKNAGANTTWRLVLFEDTGVTGLPVVANGGNIILTFNVGGIFTISDVRCKENLIPVGRLGDFPLYEYNYVGQPESSRVQGVLAQDVERVMPWAVQEFAHRDGRRKAVNYSQLPQAA